MKSYVFYIVAIVTLIATDCFSYTKNGTVYTTDGSRTDVAAAITNATAGDTINLPAGTFSWSSGITLTKQLNIIGAGSGCPSACDDATTLNLSGQAFNITADTASGFRISGITFNGAGAGDSGVIGMNHSGSGNHQIKDWRIDHNHFNGNTGRSITVGSYAPLAEPDRGRDYPGLVDGNYFTASQQNKVIQMYGGSPTPRGDWNDTLILGGSDFLFFENNKVVFTTQSTGLAGLDSDTGGRFVIRYNNFTNFWITSHGMEGFAPASLPWRSVHGWEIYNNTFAGSSTDFVIWLRGGTGVIHNNTINTTMTEGGPPIRYVDYRGDGADCGQSWACDGDYSYDGNEVGKSGYPCYMQVGTTGSNGITKMPVYQWSNTFQGSSNEVSFTLAEDGCSYPHVQLGRDVILNGSTPKPGYTIYTYPHPLAGGGSPPSAPVIIGVTAGWPADFHWTGVSGAVMYHIQVDDNSNLSSPEVDNDAVDPGAACVDTDCHYYVAYDDALAASTHYYWRVRALR